MNAQVKKWWVEALRSGHYVQGQRRLCRDNRYCCLGVLCEVAVRKYVIPPPTSSELLDGSMVYEGSETFLPQAVVQWAGLKGRNPIINGLPASLWNDTHHTPFDKIADMIEQDSSL